MSLAFIDLLHWMMAVGLNAMFNGVASSSYAVLRILTKRIYPLARQSNLWNISNSYVSMGYYSSRMFRIILYFLSQFLNVFF